MIKKSTGKSANEKLLKIPKVVDEINRHLWIESEKHGYDIGFEKASEDWLERYALSWTAYHMPKPVKSSAAKTPRKKAKKK